MEILFVLRHNKHNKYKPATIYCRITLEGIRANGDFSTFIRIKPEEWNSKAQKIISKRSGTDQDNETLENIRNAIKDLYNESTRRGTILTAQSLKLEYLKGSKPTNSFLEVFKQLIERKKIKKFASGTIQQNESKYRNVERFLHSISRPDLLPAEFTLKLIDNFDYYLRTTLKSVSQNHISKHLQLIKEVLKHATRQGYISSNPLEYIEIPFEKPKLPIFLTIEEMTLLERFKFANGILQTVTDLYLFQCYTGFAYIDLITFHPDQHIQKDANMFWIYKERQKSGEMAILPFFDNARKIVDKYNGKLPKITNQVYNRFLKEIAVILNIRKKLTTHTARKTAATLWLNAGVPEETVSRMLGQNTTKHLKIYARIQPKKIAEDTKMLGK